MSGAAQGRVADGGRSSSQAMYQPGGRPPTDGPRSVTTDLHLACRGRRATNRWTPPHRHAAVPIATVRPTGMRFLMLFRNDTTTEFSNNTDGLQL